MGMKKADVSKSMSAEKLVQLNLLRKLCAQGKINVAKELATSITDSGEKVLIFSSFIEPLKTLKEFFKEEAVMISGETPVQERGEIVKAFQTNKNIKIFLGGYKSAGTGITLTAAQNFIGIDYPWNPADLQQSHDRLHRPSQTASNVNIYQLVTIDTIDEDMKGILDTKQGIFDQVIEGKKNKNSETAMDSALNRVLKNY
jgi:SNF2 family DNA or RNA helicase